MKHMKVRQDWKLLGYPVRFLELVPVVLIFLTVISNGGFLRYSVYLAPAVLVLLSVFQNRFVNVLSVPLRFYLLLICVSIVPFLVGGERASTLVVLTLWPLLPVIFRTGFHHSSLIILFWMIFAYQLFIAASTGFKFAELDFVNSISAGETHTLPFIFGALMFPFIKQRQRVHVLLCFLALIIAGKRIALLASFVGVVAWLIIYSIGRGKEAGRKIFLITAPASILILDLYLPDLFLAASDYLHANENIFSAGRVIGQERAYFELFNSSFDFTYFFGQGLGTADELAFLSWGIEGIQIHNDGLRLLLDYGIIGGLLYAYGYIALLTWRTGPTGLYLAAYVLVLWLSDNTITYPFFNVCVGLVTLNSRDSFRMRCKAPALPIWNRGPNLKSART